MLVLFRSLSTVFAALLALQCAASMNTDEFENQHMLRAGDTVWFKGFTSEMEVRKINEASSEFPLTSAFPFYEDITKLNGICGKFGRMEGDEIYLIDAQFSEGAQVMTFPPESFIEGHPMRIIDHEDRSLIRRRAIVKSRSPLWLLDCDQERRFEARVLDSDGVGYELHWVKARNLVPEDWHPKECGYETAEAWTERSKQMCGGQAPHSESEHLGQNVVLRGTINGGKIIYRVPSEPQDKFYYVYFDDFWNLQPMMFPESSLNFNDHQAQPAPHNPPTYALNWNDDSHINEPSDRAGQSDSNVSANLRKSQKEIAVLRKVLEMQKSQSKRENDALKQSLVQNGSELTDSRQKIEDLKRSLKQKNRELTDSQKTIGQLMNDLRKKDAQSAKVKRLEDKISRMQKENAKSLQKAREQFEEDLEKEREARGEIEKQLSASKDMEKELLRDNQSMLEEIKNFESELSNLERYKQERDAHKKARKKVSKSLKKLRVTLKEEFEEKCAVMQKKHTAAQENLCDNHASAVRNLRGQIQSMEDDLHTRKRVIISLADQIDGKVPEHLECPISKELFVEPVIASDGKTYSRSHIVEWMADMQSALERGEEPNSPFGIPFKNWDLKPVDKQAEIDQWFEQLCQDEDPQ